MSLIKLFEAVRTVFVKLFCTPTGSMDNSSLRVKTYGSRASRTFIAEESTCWSKAKRGKKGFSKSNESLRKGGFRTSLSQKGSSSDYNSHKGIGKDQGEKGKESVYPHSGPSSSLKRNKFIPRNQSIGIPNALMVHPVQLAQALLRRLCS